MKPTNSDLIDDVERVCEDLIPEVTNAYAGLGKGPVLKQVIRFYKKYDADTARFNDDIACRSGCDFCCHYHVVVTATEVFALAEHLGKLPKPEREEIYARIKATANTVSKMTADEYIGTNVPCALLKDGKCSVYQVRPLACRGHHSLDVTVCKETFDDTKSTALAPKIYEREVTTTSLQNAHLFVQHHKKVDTTVYELHAALNDAISNKASFQRWLDHKMTFPNVRDRSNPFSDVKFIA